MNSFDLDDLRGRWQAQNKKIGASLDLDPEALARLLAARTQTSVNKRQRSLGVTILLSGLTLAALLLFAALVSGLAYRTSALVLCMFTASALVSSVLERRALKALRPDGVPSAAVDVVTVLRAREWAVTRAIIACSVLLWWPFLLVLARSFGVDLAATMDPSVPLVHIGLGLVILPLLWFVFRIIERRTQHHGAPEFSLDGSGDALLDIQWRLMAQQRAILDPAMAAVVPEDWKSRNRSNRRRLFAGILVCSTIMAVNGLHMAISGGQWLVIATGILLQLGAVAWMINTLTHWRQLGQVAEHAVSCADWIRHADRVESLQRFTIPVLASLLPSVVAAGVCSWFNPGLGLALTILLSGLAASAGMAANPTAMTVYPESVRARMFRVIASLLRFGVFGDARSTMSAES